MFTIKFLRAKVDTSLKEDECGVIEKITSFAVPCYEVTEDDEGSIVITLFPSIDRQQGFNVIVSTSNDDYSWCYIENEKGKTIDSYDSSMSMYKKGK